MYFSDYKVGSNIKILSYRNRTSYMREAIPDVTHTKPAQVVTFSVPTEKP